MFLLCELWFSAQPMTLHRLAVFLVSALLGPRLGPAALAAYLGAGATGLRVLSCTPERGVGLTYMAGPTGGYLLAFLLASALIGDLAAGRACQSDSGTRSRACRCRTAQIRSTRSHR